MSVRREGYCWDDIVDDDETTCACGAPATHVGRFTIRTGSGGYSDGTMLLCDTHAGQVDKGVRVEPLAQPALVVVAEGVSA